MKKKYAVQDYLDFLYRELDGLIDLCYLFDQKEKFERASNMATALRVLLHDTSQSTSILKHLGDKSSISFYNSSIPNYDNVEFMTSMIVGTHHTKDGTAEQLKPFAAPKCFAYEKFNDTQSFDDWWNHILIKYENKTFTRRDLVWITANKFGSAHADENVDALYYDLAKGLPSMIFFSDEIDSEKLPIENIIYSVIRQISHEVICTLVDHYHLDLDYEVEMKSEHYSKEYYILESLMTLEEILEYAPDYINKKDLYK